jgi:hypothetical protein
VATGGSRFLTIGAAAGSLALLAAVVLMLWPADPADYSFSNGRGQPDGETVGWVSKVEANTIHVNSGPFGNGVVPLVVTKATRIMVGTKEGWFEDIRPGGQVKVAYELYHGRRFARNVELLVEEGTRRPVRPAGQVRVPAAPVTAEREPARAPAGVAPETRPAPALAPTSERPAPERGADVPPAPAPQPVPTPARPQPTDVVPTPRASSSTGTRNMSAPEHGSRAPEPARAPDSPRPAAPRAPEPSRSVESGDPTDGSAAVDWLLKGRR